MNIGLVLQIVVSLLLIVLITLQSRDSSLGSGFSSTQKGFHTKRGPEKILYLATIFTSLIFLGLSFLNITIWK
ncbi:preprotein translocase subunit SecG [Candidatus Collierbacteria bacterium RIFOXYD1_FULL_40_9]|uniref:Protein-export membrane protein SecG n=1 Tax=Candidatus Collierbacteria bacterium RIFOXYD1_FULL_40_9 TaxID=1817731 RepID=A0A1F5FPP3_9BACT|nr:MAG: preprotein translocase subunit SecG [Candidatus Collierbacteria bacterium RIFOXYD1_FULL_40_9]